MNLTIIAGRLTNDPEISYSSQTQNAVARFKIAADRGKKDGKDLGADFIPCVAFGKTAETFEKYVNKGDQIIVNGSIKTGSYERDGETIYTWNVQVRSFDFGQKKKEGPQEAQKEATNEDRFESIDEDVPF